MRFTLQLVSYDNMSMSYYNIVIISLLLLSLFIYYSTIRLTHFTHRKLFQKASMVPVNMVIQE